MIDPFLGATALILLLAALGSSIGVAMIAGSAVYLGLKGLDIAIAGETVLQGLYGSYTLLAIPLFILAAEIMNVGSLADRLLVFCQALVGRFRGGLGYVNIVSSVIFSGMSGSAIADAVGMGRLMINMMVRDGKYSASYAAAITAATATIGPIIPPSIPMVIYALIADQSVGFLFAAGIAPGLLMAVAMAVVNGTVAARRQYPVDEALPLNAFPGITIRAFPALMLPVVLLGGIYSGVMTPTEAAAVAAFYALLISVLIYRSVSLRAFFATMLSSARSTATVGILVAGALAFNYVVAREDVPETLSNFVASMELSAVGFLIAINILFLLLGCIVDAGVILLIIVPVFIPAAQALGIDLVHFGVVVVVNSMIGLITPPYGLLLLVVSNITGLNQRSIVVEIIPFILALVAVLVLITFVPDFVLFVPRLFGYPG